MSLPPLPGPDVATLLVSRGGTQSAPMSRRALQAAVKSGAFAPEDYFFVEGMEAWAAIGDHPALFADLAAEAPEDRLERVFGRLVKESWAYYDEQQYASTIDEVFLGAVITATLDNGYSLIDLSSDGTHHYVRFQQIDGGSRILCRLTHLTASVTTAKVSGHRASVVLGYGERMDDFNRIFKALRAEAKSGYLQSAEPGTITVDGDMNTGYVYVQVDLFLKIDDYIGNNYQVNYDTLREHLAATLHTLRKYLRGRFAK